jgi:gamma-glutamyl hercynylcysteine S-oxide synthase
MGALCTTLPSQEALLERLHLARKQSDELFSIVKPEFLYERPIAERHRIVFYIGHLEAFDWNLLRERTFQAEAFNADFDRLFAFGIDPVDGGLPSDQPKDWPSLEKVRNYVAYVRKTIDDNLSGHFSKNTGTLLNVAIEHRLMHAETLAYMLHQLPYDQKQQLHSKPNLVTDLVTPSMVEIPSGAATLGLSRNDAQFGWDNEYETHTVDIPAFAIDKYMLTNGQFLEFIAAGGYQKEELWTESDWQWITENEIQHPVFWERSGDGWNYRTMFEGISLPLDWPVYVSHAEASAYARWAGKSLPTEAQWHRAAYGTPEAGEAAYPWGYAEPDSHRGNFDFYRWNPTRIGAFPQGQSSFGASDMLGNGWEWTSTVFQPFAGFEAFPFYRGYSADFFDGKHYVIKGGSARTGASMLRRSFRNWFQPHYQYVYAGFRCVSNRG